MVRRLRRLATPQRALWLYAVLVLLPAAVFAYLASQQLRADHERQLRSAPQSAESAATRLFERFVQQRDTLLKAEEARSPFEFSELLWQGELRDSPLTTGSRPDGLIAWFTYDRAEEGPGNQIEVAFFFGDGPSEEVLRLDEALRPIVREHVIERNVAAPIYMFAEEDELRSRKGVRVSPGAVACLLNYRNRFHCRESEIARFAEAASAETSIQVNTGPPYFQLVQGADGAKYIIGLRMVLTRPYDPTHRTDQPDCLQTLLYENILWQGWIIDGDYLLDRLPRALADEDLSSDLRLIPIGDLDAARYGTNWKFSPHVRLLTGLDIGVDNAQIDLGTFVVGVDTGPLERRLETQRFWFTGLTGTMFASVVLGLTLLIGRLREAAEHARRTENFIAAVTHELRTPLASVKLYSEMLADGWVRDPDKQVEYARRIAKETDRLDGLVDRVLEKRRLSGKPPKSRPGDLSAEVAQAGEELGLKPAEDVRFELDESLPEVLLTREAVYAMVSNLVENARKYAPASAGQTTSEPILVRTQLDGRGRVILEVSDRGPGIEPKERVRVFDAFYRVGNEATRTTQGTGLGLHLVAQYARFLRGKAEVLERPGGGTTIRVRFKRAT